MRSILLPTPERRKTLETINTKKNLWTLHNGNAVGKCENKLAL
jgi:hypothetical protein